MEAMEPLPAAPTPIGLREPSLPLSPPCGHSLAGHAAIRLRFGRKVEVSMCATGGVDLSTSMERSMHAVTRTIALVLVMLGLGTALLAAQANPPPPIQANPPPPPPPPAQANPPPPGSPAPQGP